MQEILRGPRGQGELDFLKLAPRAHLTPLGFLMRDIWEVNLVIGLHYNLPPSGKAGIGLIYSAPILFPPTFNPQRVPRSTENSSNNENMV